MFFDSTPERKMKEVTHLLPPEWQEALKSKGKQLFVQDMAANDRVALDKLIDNPKKDGKPEDDPNLLFLCMCLVDEKGEYAIPQTHRAEFARKLPASNFVALVGAASEVSRFFTAPETGSPSPSGSST